jgi:uncharacterized protein
MGGDGKVIYDNVAGFINLDDGQLSVINHPLFQRLRRIKQNGFLNYVFTGAEHSRFAHSLGVFKNMVDLLENFERENNPLEDRDDKEILLYSALLHDIGHYPLSHTIEGLLTRKEFGGDKGHHENNSREFLKKSTLGDEVGEVVDLDEVCRIITGKSKRNLYTQILHSELDMDRLDYLLRDSLNCGLKYGVFDRDQLMRTLEIHEGNQLVVNEKGRTAAEHYVLGRYYMYSEIYTHHTSNSFDILAKEIYKELMKNGVAPTLDELQECPDEYYWFDDNWFFNELHRISPDDTSVRILDFKNRILFRYPLKVAKEYRYLKGFNEQFSEDLLKNIRIKNIILEESGVPDDYFFMSFPSLEISKLRPYYEFNSRENSEEMDEREVQSIKIKDENGDIKKIASDKRSIINELSTKDLYIARAYTSEEYEVKVRKAIESLISP